MKPCAQSAVEVSLSIVPIEEIMEVLQTTKKGRHMDTVEKFYIFKETRINNQINDKNTVNPNAIFEALLGPYKRKD